MRARDFSHQGRVRRADRARTRHLLRNSRGSVLRPRRVSGPATLTLRDWFEPVCDSAKGCRRPRRRSEWTALLPEFSDREETSLVDPSMEKAVIAFECALLCQPASHNRERPAAKTGSDRICCNLHDENLAVNSNRNMEYEAEESGTLPLTPANIAHGGGNLYASTPDPSAPYRINI